MTENIWIATIAAVPPTLAAIAALWQVRRLSRPLDEVNRAVNHRKPGERRLIEMVDAIADDVHDLRDDIREVRGELGQHRAWHQIREEGALLDDDPEEIE
jgi:ABC-type transporter Mla subunit MlaD